MSTDLMKFFTSKHRMNKIKALQVKPNNVCIQVHLMNIPMCVAFISVCLY